MKVLIATVTAGAGHLQAANALHEVWTEARPQDEVAKEDVLDYTSRLFRKAYSEGYVKMVERAPELYAAFFSRTDDARLMRKWTRTRRTLSLLQAQKFVRYLKRSDPDLILCPHFLPLEIVGYLRSHSKGDRRPYCVCIVTDFEAHAFWIEPCVDLYCVATEETKGRLIARGVPEDAIVVTGIPVAKKFSQPIDQSAVRRTLGIRDDLPTILVLSGGFGMGPVASILSALDTVKAEFQTLVVCGRNPDLRQQIAPLDRSHPTRVLGFAGNMQELMAVADLIVTKPGGLTSSETLAMGRPMLIVNPIPGQEAANADFLLERGVAIKVNSLDDIASRVERLLGSEQLAAMASRAVATGKPHAAETICKAVASRLS
ncbi:MAG: UDP-N-acetylglucosamine 2-epimerase [Bryobacterales bacterium]|nr:UDP-N-acetylglucosamine 2-epimerase [Bryobacterales bacterium]